MTGAVQTSELANTVRETHLLMAARDSSRELLVHLLHDRLGAPITPECPIACLALSSRTHSGLTREHGLDMTVEALMRVLPRVHEVPAIGRASVREIESHLAGHGFEFTHNLCPKKYRAISRQCPLGCLTLTRKTHGELLRAHVSRVGQVVHMAKKGLWAFPVEEALAQEVIERLLMVGLIDRDAS